MSDYFYLFYVIFDLKNLFELITFLWITYLNINKYLISKPNFSLYFLLCVMKSVNEEKSENTRFFLNVRFIQFLGALLGYF